VSCQDECLGSADVRDAWLQHTAPLGDTTTKAGAIFEQIEARLVDPQRRMRALRTRCEAREAGRTRDEVLAADGDRNLGHQRTRTETSDLHVRRSLAVTGKPLRPNGDDLRTFGLPASQAQQYVALDLDVVAPELLTPMAIGVDASLDRDSVPAIWCRGLRRRLPSCSGGR
jgi:hypothetical protein